MVGGLLINGIFKNICFSGKINLEGGIINLFSIELCLDCSYKNIVEFNFNNRFDFMLDI